MAQDLNPVQVKLVNEVHRPFIERCLAYAAYLKAYIAECDNQQSPILSNGEVLNDDIGGVSPRTDAPQLTGANLTQARNLAASQLAKLDGVTEDLLISLAVRDVPTITGANG